MAWLGIAAFGVSGRAPRKTFLRGALATSSYGRFFSVEPPCASYDPRRYQGTEVQACDRHSDGQL